MPAFPQAASQSHGVFKLGDDSFDPSPEPAKAMVQMFTAAHIGLFKTALFFELQVVIVLDGHKFGLFVTYLT